MPAFAAPLLFPFHTFLKDNALAQGAKRNAHVEHDAGGGMEATQFFGAVGSSSFYLDMGHGEYQVFERLTDDEAADTCTMERADMVHEL